MSIFSLVKGGKEHGVFEMRMFCGEILNSYRKGIYMTRREIRENIFKMLFRVEFHDAEELSEQLSLHDEDLEAEIMVKKIYEEEFGEGMSDDSDI